ncbi:Bidirectional sugar transporter SWEET [Heracleum sosnowskyi]|uniref:Bidirectional sugar transporter SWEET n=1 Tax=Heracleum sosnowskyi TaxID=360622 RepID=A0AAD8H9R2_9APIA|nr:Bidirectional sugar transporter SWEET [Heracleum sosnowskyi]
MMNCLVWLLYGMPFITPGSILVLTANSFGLVIHLAYLIIFLLYVKDHRQRICAGGIFLLELALVGLVSGLVIRLAHTYMMRAALVGAFGGFISALIIICRFSPVVTFWVEGSLESKSFLVVLSSTLHDLCWLIYASVRFEMFLLFTHCAGFFVGVVQLVQYGIYYKSTPKSGDDKVATAEVQLQIIGTGDD